MFDSAETTDALTVGAGINITLDLNGCMLKYNNDTAKNSVITVIGTFTLKDSNTDTTKKHEITDKDGETIEISGGVITGGTGTSQYYEHTDYYSYNGGGVFVSDFGTFIMNGGNICANNVLDDGGGVHVAGGTFIMNDGTISYNYSDDDGGGVSVESTYSQGELIAEGAFTMNGGTIGYNIADEEGGGVYVYEGAFTMNGGAISYNRTDYFNDGGGVYIEDGTFIMTGGKL